MVSRRVLGYLLLAAAFAVGAACGGGAAFAYVAKRHTTMLHEGRGPESRRMRALSRRLELDTDQEQRIRAILAKDRDTMRDLGRAMFESCGGPIRDQKARVDAAIREVLRPEQQKRYDELLDRREQFWLGPDLVRRRGEGR
jgi:Spy/CpxP family protein refolding chaperone